MDRRHFIKQSSAWMMVGGLLIPPALAATKVEWDEGFTVPELELVGRTQPELLGDGFNLRKKAAEAYDAMRAAALKEGIDLYSVSSYRSFDRQMGIWNRKYIEYRAEGDSPDAAIQRIIEYSTLPGSSRHHWGTDLDISDQAKPEPSDSPLIARHFEPGGIYEELYRWMLAHAHEYGFFMPYTNDPERKGFAYEPWHWSYAPLSIPLLIQYKTVSLKTHVEQAGVEGKEHLTDSFLQYYKKVWGFGINSILIPPQS
ncbi:MAG: M15 family metallopeptidase [bacterium]|jgi:LAS superfamily LD-carboxypeptidase LdcB|nr:M15 family metallopeptidase [bacterium]